MTIYFSELRSPQVADAAEHGALLVLPLGQTEEHGPHLPVGTDAIIARRLCDEAVCQLDGEPLAYLLDTVTYGYSQEALTEWPGTIIVPQATLIEMLTSTLVSLADMGFRKIAVVSLHGNHDGVTRVVAREVADACGVGPGLFFPAACVGGVLEEHGKAGATGSCHGGEMETSLMLHLAPELVDMSAAPKGDELKSPKPFPSSQAFVSTWTLQKSRAGIYGDPTVATAELGKLLFDTMVAETVRFLRYYHGVEQV